jgi:cytosine/uracil/thiamine/allantoin permease
MVKSPPDLVDRFNAVLDRYPDAGRKQMFGYPAAFIGGNLATSLFADHWIVRLGQPDLAELMSLEGSGELEVMPGRRMKGYAIVPPGIVADDTALDGWLERAFAYARTLPAKK